MPTLEYVKIPGVPAHLRVRIDAGEPFPESGKSLRYPTWIGVIHQDGRVNTWTLAASVFRGYKREATAWLNALAADPATLARFNQD